VMQGQAHNIDDFGAPNWSSTSNGDDLIVKFWQWYRSANRKDGHGEERTAEYFTRWDGSRIDQSKVATSAPLAVERPTHRDGTSIGIGQPEHAPELLPHYMQAGPIADYPPINHMHYTKQQEWTKLGEAVPKLGIASVVGASAGLITASLSPVAAIVDQLPLP